MQAFCERHSLRDLLERVKATVAKAEAAKAEAAANDEAGTGMPSFY